jgi:hypothetical protein
MRSLLITLPILVSVATLQTAQANECKGLAPSTRYYLHKFERRYPHYNIKDDFHIVYRRPDFRYLPDDIFDQ